MTQMTAKQRSAWERSRDLNADLRDAVADAKQSRWARKTEFQPLANGSMHRRITQRDGTIEKDEVIPAS